MNKNNTNKQGDGLMDRKDLERLIKGLKIQYNRMQKTGVDSLNKLNVGTAEALRELAESVNHDLSYYVVLLRRFYRQINLLSKIDKDIAKLKNDNTDFLEKIWIRDHFEHNLNVSAVPSVTLIPSITVVRGLILNPKKEGIGVHIKVESGDIKWDMDKDHADFIKIAMQVIELCPEIDPFRDL